MTVTERIHLQINNCVSTCICLETRNINYGMALFESLMAKFKFVPKIRFLWGNNYLKNL